MPGYTGVVPVGNPRKELYCSQCLLLLREALQTAEGDRICRSCWEGKRRSGVWWTLDLQCYPDRAVDREVQSLEVFCQNDGCLWQGKLADLEEHCKECGEGPSLKRCQNKGCGELVPTSEIKYHSMKACPYRIVACKHCNKKMQAKTLQDHVSSCEYQPQLCTNEGCGNVISLKARKQNTCAYRLVTCRNCRLTLITNQLRARDARCSAMWPEMQGNSTPIKRTQRQVQSVADLFTIQQQKSESEDSCDSEYINKGTSASGNSQGLPLVRKRNLEVSSGEVDAHQITTTLSLFGNVLKTQRKLRSKLQEALELSKIKKTHTGELIRVKSELLAFSRQLSQHSRLLEQKLNAIGSACCTNFAQLLHMNRCLKEKFTERSQGLLHQLELRAYQGMLTCLEQLESTLQRDMLKVKQSIVHIPPSQNGWIKRQRVYRNGEPHSGAWASMVEEKVENLEKKVEKLEETNKLLQNRVTELETMQKAPNIVKGLGDDEDDEPQITLSVFHDCFVNIKRWIDVKAIVPQLMKHRIISGPDDVHRFTQGPPAQNMIELYTKLCESKNGFQIFYRCLRQSQDDHLGHKDAADRLKETAQKIKPGPSLLSPDSPRSL